MARSKTVPEKSEMSKRNQTDHITPRVKMSGKGVQANSQNYDDFDAVEMFQAATSPPSVKRMVGSRDEFARIKHDRDGSE
jgi:hypothetical protein